LQLVLDHRDEIRQAAARYDVDPRLIASIVYVNHRDQLSPFRHALETLVISAWAQDRTGDIFLGRPLDISVGLAQVKPRTAQTAGLKARGLTIRDLSQQQYFWFRDTDRVDAFWSAASQPPSFDPPFQVPPPKPVIVSALLNDETNVATCALILALYQPQWESANAAWSLRSRPEILATLYQIGFLRSKPHGSPNSNSFGNRVSDVYRQPWLLDVFAARVEEPARPAEG
jgi:hypothetical protein